MKIDIIIDLGECEIEGWRWLYCHHMIVICYSDRWKPSFTDAFFSDRMIINEN